MQPKMRCPQTRFRVDAHGSRLRGTCAHLMYLNTPHDYPGAYRSLKCVEQIFLCSLPLTNQLARGGSTYDDQCVDVGINSRCWISLRMSISPTIGRFHMSVCLYGGELFLHDHQHVDQHQRSA